MLSIIVSVELTFDLLLLLLMHTSKLNQSARSDERLCPAVVRARHWLRWEKKNQTRKSLVSHSSWFLFFYFLFLFLLGLYRFRLSSWNQFPIDDWRNWKTHVSTRYPAVSISNGSRLQSIDRPYAIRSVLVGPVQSATFAGFSLLSRNVYTYLWNSLNYLVANWLFFASRELWTESGEGLEPHRSCGSLSFIFPSVGVKRRATHTYIHTYKRARSPRRKFKK